MIPRGTIIAALLVVELAIVGEAAVAIHGGQSGPAARSEASIDVAAGPGLSEGGPHRVFGTGPHPALLVEIGYADLTILTGKPAQIDVSVSASSDFGYFRAKNPITTRADGDTVRIATTGRHGWSMGDDRMVTVLVPPETQVTVVSAGDIKATGLRGASSFTSVGRGSITIDDYSAPVLRAVSSNGRILLHGIVTANLDATSSDGRVEGSALRVRDGSVESGGRVTLSFAPGTDTLVTARTSDGRISVSGFPAGASSSPVRAKSDDNDDDDDAASRTVRVGAGSGRLDVHSSDGNVTLAQEG